MGKEFGQQRVEFRYPHSTNWFCSFVSPIALRYVRLVGQGRVEYPLRRGWEKWSGVQVERSKLKRKKLIRRDARVRSTTFVVPPCSRQRPPKTLCERHSVIYHSSDAEESAAFQSRSQRRRFDTSRLRSLFRFFPFSVFTFSPRSCKSCTIRLYR